MRSRRVLAITAELKAAVEGTAAGIAYELITRLHDRNPKATTHSSKNWIATAGSRLAFEVGSREQPDGGPQAASIGWLSDYVLEMGDLHVSNNVHYMEALMQGSSKQAPAGWVEAVIDSVIEHADAIFRRYGRVVQRKR